MTERITAKRAVELLNEVVTEAGVDFVYTAPEAGGGICRYEVNGEASCGVGRALVKAGVSVDTLKLMDTSLNAGIASSNVRDILGRADVKLTVEAANLLNTFQFHQDRAVPYGSAFSQALAEVG